MIKSEIPKFIEVIFVNDYTLFCEYFLKLFAI